MSVTNAISSVIIVGAYYSGPRQSEIIFNLSSIFGFLAIFFSSNKYFWWISSNPKDVSYV